LDKVEILDTFLNHCKEKHIDVVFVYSPQYIDVFKVINPYEIRNIYSNFACKYDIPFLDYSNDAMSNDTAYFYNDMHMNKIGADIFTTKLSRDIDSLKILK
jgi:hypothetical protein